MGFSLALLNLAGSVAPLLWRHRPHQRTTPAYLMQNPLMLPTGQAEAK